MEASELRLVPPVAAAVPLRRLPALAWGLSLVGAAVLATLSGADEARREVEVRELAEQALKTALAEGSAAPEVRETLSGLRRTIGWRPLESKTRVVYASLVLGLSTRIEDMRLAAFHAERAATLAPVTVSVVRAAALVLAHTGRIDDALALVRHMFDYDAPRAAETLAQLESLVLGARLEAGLPATPQAWVAWAKELREAGRRDEARAWFGEAHARWPENVPALVETAGAAFARRDWLALEALLPPGKLLPETAEAAPLHAWRASLRLHLEDAEGARADLARALTLSDGASTRLLAGEVFEQAGDFERARAEWNRALHTLGPGRGSMRSALLLRLARLEDRRGRPAAALELWRELLALDPAHREARRRIDDLAGFQR